MGVSRSKTRSIPSHRTMVLFNPSFPQRLRELQYTPEYFVVEMNIKMLHPTDRVVVMYLTAFMEAPNNCYILFIHPEVVDSHTYKPTKVEKSTTELTLSL
jgi:hypothetical protein